MRKVVVYVPVQHADRIRSVIGEAGGGKIGNYSHATFTTRGTGRFRPEAGANPAIGEVGKLEAVDEEKIEFVCDDETFAAVIAAIRKEHPYEEPAIDSWPIEMA